MIRRLLNYLTDMLETAEALGATLGETGEDDE